MGSTCRSKSRTSSALRSSSRGKFIITFCTVALAVQSANKIYTSRSAEAPERTPSVSKMTTNALMNHDHGCAFLGIGDIERVGMEETSAVQGETWFKGYFPYPSCPRSARSNTHLGPTTIVTVMDMNYIEVLPTWAGEVHSVRHECFVVAVDYLVCAEARKQHCGCMDSNEPPQQLVNKSGWHPNRLISVRKRFEGALFLLENGKNVFMHDADVLFMKDGMKALFEYIRGLHHLAYDFVVQDNGVRKVSYDGLNWGFVWMHNTKASRALLQCTLDRWDSPAFGCNRTQSDCSPYYKRSQPRINHILELASMNKMCSVCKFPAISSFKAKHMSGYPSTAAKLTCAKGDGYLRDVLSATVAYSVPAGTSIVAQRRALIGALHIAKLAGIKLEAPRAHFAGEFHNFCSVFDVSNISPHIATPKLSSCTRMVSDVRNIEKVVGTGERICLDFDMISKLQLDHNTPLSVPVCNPHNPYYMKIHCCERPKGKDEVDVLSFDFDSPAS